MRARSVGWFGLVWLVACSGGSTEPGVHIPFPTAAVVFPGSPPGRGLSNPKEVVVADDGARAWVLERGAGRLAAIELRTGAISRFEPPDGQPITHLGRSADGSFVWVVSGTPAGIESAPYATLGARPATIWRFDVASHGYSRVRDEPAITGFFVDSAGTGYFDTTTTLGHVSFEDGSRVVLRACTDAVPEAIDPGGRFVAWHATRPPIDHHDGPHLDLHVCDLTTGASASVEVSPVASEIVSFACGGRWLVRARSGFPLESNEPDARSDFFDVYDPATLERRTTIAARARPRFDGPAGPVVTSAACDRLWFSVPSGVEELELASGTLRELVHGAGPVVGAFRAASRHTTFVATVGDGGIRFHTLDLSDGALSDEWDSTGFYAPSGAVFRRDAEELVLGFGRHYQNLYPFEQYDYSVIQRYRPASDILETGDAQRDVLVGGLGLCEASGEPMAWASFAGGGGQLASVDGLRLVADPRGPPRRRTDLPSPPAPVEGSSVPMEIGRDCRYVYLGNGRIFRVDRATNRMELVATPDLVDTFTLDPRQDALLVQSHDTIHAIDLHTGRSTVLATGVPRTRAMRANDDGKLVLIGDRELAIGVLDLVTGEATRLWEGHGPLARWVRDFDFDEPT